VYPTAPLSPFIDHQSIREDDLHHLPSQPP
jgi:hypothetical protein